MSLDKEYATGKWNGKDIRFNRVFRGHRFTDEEVAALLKGEEIPVEGLVTKDGKTYGVIGTLEEQSFTNEAGEDIKFIGFKQTGFVEGVPTIWCGHTFTDEERSALEEGKTLTLTGLTSKKGTTFDAVVRYGADESGKKRIIAEFDDKFPDTWCGHTFTDEEKAALNNGGALNLTGLVSKNGNSFNASVRYEQDENGKKRLKAEFNDSEKTAKEDENTEDIENKGGV
ncbi:MAG: DUF3945 domain-containing protein [Lachnospiraceae bacterium]|nr:DUF3945 domain-containing protein [Lachnospiraceae bacterium]